MNCSLHSYMKVGIVQFMAFPETAKGEGPVLENMAKIAEDVFFGAVEITSIPDPKLRKQVARLLETAGLIVGFGAQPIELGNKLDLNSLEPATRKTAVDFMKKSIDEAYEVGARRFAVLSGPYPGDDKAKAATDALVDSLDQLNGYAKSQGSMGLVIEVFDRTIDKKSLIGPTSEGVALSKALRQKYPDFGLMIDLSHLPLQFESAEQSLGLAAEHLVHAHIGNAVIRDRASKLYGDLHPRFSIAEGENGVPEVVEFLRMLFQIGYIGEGKQNIVAFEVKPYGDETSGAVVAQAKRTLLEAWARLSL